MSALPACQVLILEDDLLDAAAWTRFLGEGGTFETRLVHSLAEASHELERQEFDALLLDHEVLDGESTELLPLDPGDSATGVLVLSSYREARQAMGALQVGAHHFMLKADVTPTILREAVLESIAVADERRCRDLAATRLVEVLQALEQEVPATGPAGNLIQEAGLLAGHLLDPNDPRVQG